MAWFDRTSFGLNAVVDWDCWFFSNFVSARTAFNTTFRVGFCPDETGVRYTSISRRNSLYVGLGQAVTHSVWYEHIVRAEYRYTF